MSTAYNVQLRMFAPNKYITSWKKGLTKETCIHLARQSENMKGHVPPNKGMTKETMPSIAVMAAKLRGRSKETHIGYAIMAEKLRGRPSWKRGLTKDTCPSIAAQSAKRKGKNKDNDAAYAIISQKLTGRRKETHPGVASMIEKLKGRIVWNKGLTKETNPIIAARSEKVRGRTKENDPSVVRRADKLRGRTKYTHAYLAESGRKKSLCVGELSSNWIDGRSFLPYSPGFNKITKARVRERDNHICQGCGITEDKHQQITKLHSVLAIHHIDYSKDNASESNLISLCTKCNSAANKDREFWSAFYHDKLCANTIKWF